MSLAVVSRRAVERWGQKLGLTGHGGTAAGG